MKTTMNVSSLKTTSITTSFIGTLDNCIHRERNKKFILFFQYKTFNKSRAFVTQLTPSNIFNKDIQDTNFHYPNNRII